jgi:hypothetical protein
MGWSGGVDVFDNVAGEIIAQNIDEDSAFAVLDALIDALEDQDWDTESDSEYYNHPLIKLVFKKRHPDWFDKDEE